jgi:hypothetical protein
MSTGSLNDLARARELNCLDLERLGFWPHGHCPHCHGEASDHAHPWNSAAYGASVFLPGRVACVGRCPIEPLIITACCTASENPEDGAEDLLAVDDDGHWDILIAYAAQQHGPPGRSAQ